ncbi:hypothetical protein P7D52_13345 [Enterococcus dongliensis]|uniref:Uncharacterized protein n=1 Tax=Enterococcus dongliensis TaxID=2559925 RepID=A0AAW8TM75_9ENTE|nr:hypothetical protein [Enterococcus dongliensis]MDT2638160.1 hypothetical protein [Enterococcus dongliensis]MDT2643760.1 hypothetical protein [Enterococcus dongliensis]MDT2648337.1 hypothetical protein [Enterococcus dongliensis]
MGEIKKNRKRIPIVTATDNRYAIYTEVMLRTLVENIGEETTIDFYIIYDGLTERNVKGHNKMLVWGCGCFSGPFLTNTSLLLPILKRT